MDGWMYVCMYVSMYGCRYGCMYMFLYVYIYIYIHTYKHTYICTSRYITVCICIHIHTYHVCMYTYIRTHPYLLPLPPSQPLVGAQHLVVGRRPGNAVPGFRTCQRAFRKLGFPARFRFGDGVGFRV